MSEVGVACGLAFTPEGALLVGDRSGTIFRVLPNGRAAMVASLPPSVAAFHLAMGPDGHLYVTAPTLTARDNVYRVSLDGNVEVAWSGFGRRRGWPSVPTAPSTSSRRCQGRADCIEWSWSRRRHHNWC